MPTLIASPPILLADSVRITPPTRSAPYSRGSSYAINRRLPKLAAEAGVTLPKPVRTALDVLDGYDHQPAPLNRGATVEALRTRVAAGDDTAAAELAAVPTSEQFAQAASIVNQTRRRQRRSLYVKVLAAVAANADELHTALAAELTTTIDRQAAFHPTIDEPVLAAHHDAVRACWQLVDTVTHGTITANVTQELYLVADYEHPLDVFEHLLARKEWPLPGRQQNVLERIADDGTPQIGTSVPRPTLAEIAAHPDWGAVLSTAPETLHRLDQLRTTFEA